MEKSLEGIPPLFPEPFREAVTALLTEKGDRVEELRLRAGSPAAWAGSGREFPLLSEGQSLPVKAPMLEEIVRRASGRAIYAVEDQLAQGFLSLPMGHRLGLCGTAVLESGKIRTQRELQALDLRLARERPGCADAAAGFVWSHPDSTLILGPPGAGKTTILRDLIRQCSDRYGMRIALADERGEVAACREGQPQLAVGRRTDVLSHCPKAAGIELLLRAMAPEWIALDEITAAADVEALVQASYCGLRFFATAHGSGPEDLHSRPVYRALLEAGIFENLILIRQDRSLRCERLTRSR